MAERKRARFGIVTNSMSDEVYMLLDQKGKNQDLTQYIIGLVEKDIEKKNIKENYTFIKKEMEDTKLEILQLKKKIMECNELISLINKRNDDNPLQ
jgi:hypothetical protein